MVNLVVTTRAGETKTIESDTGISLMEGIRDAGISELLALCGGACSCATCHVYIAPEYASLLPPMSADEEGILDGSSCRDYRSRLSCQIRLTSAIPKLELTIAPEDM
jgi:2Fe-2S ferredoxin